MRRIVILLVTTFPLLARAQQPAFRSAELARIDSVFSSYAAANVPGCALGISRRDTLILERAWGSANLEHSVPIAAGTIFEGGSVSKQFTSAAIFRLAQQGKLSLDDDIRKYVPEIPAYDATITLRHLINHTSGLRDWGAVMSIAGWPRGTRTYTQAHVLDIIARQKALNYPVGTEYLYSNSNYNLLAMIAERVSGKTLAEFTRQELFVPLGMTLTGWRDDFTRIVPGRAQAYSGSGKEWRLQMPFENVYGNSSLLTTVGDLLKWNANFGQQRLGGKDFISMLEHRGRLKSGREIRYAGGVIVSEYGGTREIYHDGATAGYRTFLARYPDAGYGIAMLCNAGNVNPVALAHQVMNVLLPPSKTAAAPARDTVGIAVPTGRLASLSGFYRHTVSDEPMEIVITNGRLRAAEGPLLIAVSERHFTTTSGRTHLVFERGAQGRRGAIRLWTDDADTTLYVPVEAPARATSNSDYTGTFFSEEADATVSMIIADGKLVWFARPSNRVPLTPSYADGFTALGNFVKFTRGTDGKVSGFNVTTGRARNVRFERVRPPD